MSTLPSLLENTCRAHRDRVAFVDVDGSTVTFQEFWQRAEASADTLAQSLTGPGPVAILGRNSVEWICWEAAISLSGRACLPLNFRLSPSEIAWQLKHSGVSAVMYSSDFSEVATALSDIGLLWLPFDTCGAAHEVGAYNAVAHPMAGREVEGDDVQRIMYTSATTGNPKGVLTSHSRIVENALSTLANQLHDATSDSRYLIATPLTHMAIGYVWPIMAVGGTCVVLGDFTPESFCDVVVESGATHTLMVPTMIGLVADYVERNPERREQLADSALSAVWYAGSPIPQATFEKAWRALGPILNQQYGLTELWTSHRSMCATMLRSDNALAKQGSCGQPLAGTEVAVFDDDRHRLPAHVHGEVAVRSSGQVLGYLNDMDATAATFHDGWTWTGDIGYQDEEGFLFIADRKKDMIISGGLNIYSAELENALSTHPCVSQCAAVGAPDPKWGETPWMFVVLTQTRTTEEELRAHVKERLGGYKAPSRIIIVDELPLGPTGKILKRALRERVRADVLGKTHVS